MKMKNIIITLIILIGYNLQAQIIYENEKAPELKFTEWINNAKGNAILQDQHIILEFWATWCSPCIESIPHMNSLTQKYSDKISFVSVNSYDTKSKIEKFLKKTEIVSYIAVDSNKYLKEALKIQTIPATVLIDKQGNLRWKGYASDLTEELINTFLDENRIIDFTKNTKVIDDEILIKNDSQDASKDIKVNLTLERFTYDQMQKYTTSIGHNYQDSFFFEVKALPISQAIIALYGSSIDDLKSSEWDYEILGNEPKLNYNMKVLSESGDKKEIIIDGIIQKMESEFNCKLEILKRKKELWVLEPNENKLQPYLSKQQDVVNSSTEYDDSSKKQSVKNMSLDELSFIFSQNFNKKIVYDSEDRKLYDLQFHIDEEDISMEWLTKELKKKFEIKLTKQERIIKVMSLSFF